MLVNLLTTFLTKKAETIVRVSFSNKLPSRFLLSFPAPEGYQNNIALRPFSSKSINNCHRNDSIRCLTSIYCLSHDD